MQQIEFYGGPFDGHYECPDSGRPAERLAWLVSKNAFGMLKGKPNKNFGAVTSVAIYELEVDDGQFRYSHSFSIALKELMTSLDLSCIQIKKGSILDS